MKKIIEKPNVLHYQFHDNDKKGQPIIYHEVKKRPITCKLFHKKIEMETPMGKSKIKKYFRCDICHVVWFNFVKHYMK